MNVLPIQRLSHKPSEEEAAAPTQINVVLNWFEELKRRVPPGKEAVSLGAGAQLGPYER
jgi:hypothetical protein